MLLLLIQYLYFFITRCSPLLFQDSSDTVFNKYLIYSQPKWFDAIKFYLNLLKTQIYESFIKDNSVFHSKPLHELLFELHFGIKCSFVELSREAIKPTASIYKKLFPRYRGILLLCVMALKQMIESKEIKFESFLMKYLNL